MSLSPVVSLIIIEDVARSKDLAYETGRILVCVRDPQSNTHHPNVLSVPTQRIPTALFEAIKNECGASPVGKDSAELESVWKHSTKMTGHDAVIYAVKSLLSQKLGVSEAKSGADFGQFRAKAVWIEKGFAAYPKESEEEAEYEPIEMLGILVLVSNPDIFPGRTGSYSHVLWTSISNFLLSYEQRNVQHIDASLNAVELCIHGLCVATAYSYLKKHVAQNMLH